MASTDSRPVPIKATAFRAYFDLRLNTGVMNSGASGLDSEVSLDGAAPADCTNEATEIGSSGHYYLDLTAAEMTADCVSIQVKSSTTNAVPRSLFIYPQEAGDIKVDVQTWLTVAVATLLTSDDLTTAVATTPVTVDDTTPVEVNVKKVNDITVDGTGTPLDPWGPV